MLLTGPLWRVGYRFRNAVDGVRFPNRSMRGTGPWPPERFAMRLTRFLALAVLSASALAFAQSSPTASVPAATEGETIGHTFPSEQSQHRLKVPGVVSEMLVKPGDRVKAGQILLKEDHAIEDSQLKLYEYVATSEVEIQAAIAKNKQAKVEYDRYYDLYHNQNQAASKNEMEKAKLDVDLTALEIEKAKQEKEKAALQVNYQRAVIEAMELRSKIDGIVEKIETKLGEVVDPQKNAITVVTNDPLWVEFNPRSSVAATFQVGQELELNYDGQTEVKRAKVIFISPVVDAKSDRHLVRLEMANPESKPAGLRVKVHLPGKVAQAETKKD
ncbi:MAG TPA: efflux RND transporter periplasmic adaptor subunit [Tepidisphaeraceae bacterium]|nr:efflux RND transporter periplasmic adaptor subunit [Tepidisphaeraceae bacterium]